MLMDLDPIRTTDIATAEGSPEPSPTKGEGLSGRRYLPETYEEVRLFALLLWRFKRPNGFLTFLGTPGGSPDGPIKWDFLFSVGELRIQVIRGVNGLELWWWGREVSAENVIAFFDYNLSKYSAEVAKCIDTLETYTLLLNPCVRHRKLANVAHEELTKINPQEPTFATNILVNPEQHRLQIDEFRKYFEDIDREALYSMLLATESAFFAESYLNLMLAVLMKDEIRASKNLFDETVRRKWKSKVERLHLDCNFVKAADLGDATIRDAKKMFDLRNRIAHSYPDREKLQVGTMWFFQSFPVLPRAVPSYKFEVQVNNQLPSKQDALAAEASASALVDFLHGLIEEEFGDSFTMLANANPLGFNESKRMYGIPYGESAILSFGVY